MNCEKCGKQIPEHLDYCPSCKLQEVFGQGQDVEVQDVEVQKEARVTNNRKPVKHDEPTLLRCRCGQRLIPAWTFCPKCDIPINRKEKVVKDMDPSYIAREDEITFATKLYLIIFSISFSFGGLTFEIGFFPAFSALWFLIALITIMAGKIHCPDNKIIKVCFWLYLIAIIVIIVHILFIVALCR